MSRSFTPSSASDGTSGAKALRRLAARGWIKGEVACDLSEAYVFLRRIEHRLQMVADEQTHEIPDDAGRLASFSLFCGYPDIDAFSRELTRRLETVQRHYAALFEDSPGLTPGGVNMVFAGQKDDPATVAALKELGYARPEQVLEIVRELAEGLATNRRRRWRSRRTLKSHASKRSSSAVAPPRLESQAR